MSARDRLASPYRRPLAAAGLATALTLAVAGLAGPGASVAGAATKPTCKPEQKAQKRDGRWKCVKRKDAVQPHEITLVAGTLKDGAFGATGYMRFPKPVTGTAYGYWQVSNGLGRHRVAFTFKNLKKTQYTPFTVGKLIPVPLNGRSMSLQLVIGKTKSNVYAL